MKEYDFKGKIAKKPENPPKFAETLKEDYEIPFVGKGLQRKHESFAASASKNARKNHGNSLEELRLSPTVAENSEKIAKNREFSAFFREKWAKTQGNKQENPWVALRKVEKRNFSLSSSGFSSFHKGNLSEDKEKVNKILMETLKIQQAKQYRKKNLGIPFNNLNFREKFQGNRYNAALLQDFCA